MKKKMLVASAVLLILISGGIYGMTKWIEHQNSPYNVSDVLDAKGVKLYKRGFRLLEEQLAAYLKEHYSGISKIEFSPIFVRGGDGQYMFDASIAAAIYDEKGNKAYIGGTIGDKTYPAYGISWDLDLSFNGVSDEEIIELRVGENRTVDVSAHEHLPEFAKLSSLPKLDKNIEAILSDKQLEGVSKNEKGSPGAKVIFNSELRKGSRLRWS